MATDLVRIESNGAVRTVTMCRGEKRNALNREMLDGLTEAFGAEPPAEERVTVLRGEGTVFCSGMDLRERLDGSDGRVPGASPIEAMLAVLEAYPLPVVGVVQGDAIAGGNELALHCDFVIASTKASFGMSLAQIGLSPTWFLCKKLMEIAGPVLTREILLLGDPVASSKMAELGIIARAVPPHRLAAETSAIVDRLAANAPLSLRAMKGLINRQLQYRGGIDHDDVDAMVAAATSSGDAKEGVLARLEKRRAAFEGK